LAVPEISRRQLAIYAVGIVVVLLLGAHYVAHGAGAQDPSTGAGAGGADIRIERAGGGRVIVHVAGAVHHPGVYRLANGARVADAVARAGGATRRAELSGVNLAAKLEDGRQIVVPERAHGPAAGGRGTAPAPAPAAAGATGVAPSTPAAPVNLNTATPEQLDTLPGVGPATVQKIVEYREQHGGFGSVDELGQISGIGDKRLAALRDLVQV
jgi:competence protein ComEA